MKLIINPCDMLIYWPEVEFRSLVSFKFFYISHCSKLIGPTKVKACCTRGRDQLLPNLKNLIIKYCERLIKLFVLPPSLTSIRVSNCVIVESIPGQDDKELESLRHFDTVASSEHCGGLASTSMTEYSPSPRINTLPCLKSLGIIGCKKLRFVPAQLDTLLELYSLRKLI